MPRATVSTRQPGGVAASFDYHRVAGDVVVSEPGGVAASLTIHEPGE